MVVNRYWSAWVYWQMKMQRRLFAVWSVLCLGRLCGVHRVRDLQGGEHRSNSTDVAAHTHVHTWHKSWHDSATLLPHRLHSASVWNSTAWWVAANKHFNRDPYKSGIIFSSSLAVTVPLVLFCFTVLIQDSLYGDQLTARPQGNTTKECSSNNALKIIKKSGSLGGCWVQVETSKSVLWILEPVPLLSSSRVHYSLSV